MTTSENTLKVKDTSFSMYIIVAFSVFPILFFLLAVAFNYNYVLSIVTTLIIYLAFSIYYFRKLKREEEVYAITVIGNTLTILKHGTFKLNDVSKIETFTRVPFGDRSLRKYIKFSFSNSEDIIFDASNFDMDYIELKDNLIAIKSNYISADSIKDNYCFLKKYNLRLTMKLLLPLLFLFSLYSCQPRPSSQTTEQLELILLGIPQNFDTASVFKFGAQKYFKFNSSDTLLVKTCSYLNEHTGEPKLPVVCNYYNTSLTPEQKENFAFLINYVKPLPTGELIKNKPAESNCDLFGGWVLIYTNTVKVKKYFLFDCNALPKQIHELCTELNTTEEDKIYTPFNNISVNTDSIVASAYKLLEKDFLENAPKSVIKFNTSEN